MKEKITILGIDPGSVFCGYGVIQKEGQRLKVIEYGAIEAKKKYSNINLRLKEIYTRLTEVIIRTSPDESAFETIFYSKNAQSLMKLSHARAVAVLASVMKDIPVFEYSPKEVKKSVTGRGGAGKEQVQFMIKTLLEIKETPGLFDVTDALAVAVCHALKRDMPKSSAKSWADFVKNNPDRIAEI
ncbi:crossover junction endodeoxyribonuclease RuvC [Bacteroidota bacterium]